MKKSEINIEDIITLMYTCNNLNDISEKLKTTTYFLKKFMKENNLYKEYHDIKIGKSKRKGCIKNDLTTGFLYKIVNNINNKVYIGITYFYIEYRLKQHLYRSQEHKYRNMPLYKAINKYGKDNFSIDLIGEFPKGILEEKEREYIKKYNSYGSNGYNATYGGEGIDTFRYSDEDIINVYNKVGTIKRTCEILRCNACAVVKRLKRNNIKTNNFNKATLSEIEIKYNELKNVGEVAKFFDYCPDTIRHKLDIIGINYRKQSLDINVESIIEDYTNGVSIKDIVKKNNLTNYLVTNILKKNEIIINNYLECNLNEYDVINYFLETKSISKTSKYFKVTRKALSDYLNTKNIRFELFFDCIPCKVCIIIDDEKFEFDSLLKCAEFLINNNFTKNKSARGIRDSISKSLKNNNTYLGYEIFKTEERNNNMKYIIKPNPDKNIYDSITEKIKENNGFCPCSIIKDLDDYKCICKDFLNQETEGECHCGRFIKIKE